MSQTYYALLTAVGEAKLANAAALGTQLQISRMAVGDGNGVLPTPTREQTALVAEKYRAGLNELKPDPVNASQIIAELVIPETTGGFWIREMGLYDEAGDLIAVSNCPPSYKPQMAEGSGRTQVLRMVLIVSSTSAVQLKIDPSVILATREFVVTTVAAELAKLDSKQSVRVATTAAIVLSGLQTIDGVSVAVGNRVLVKNQAAAATNGIYVAAAGAWARAADADSAAKVTPGMRVAVEQGAANADTIWMLTTDGSITLGTTALTFTNITLNPASFVRHSVSNPLQTAATVLRKNTGAVSASSYGDMPLELRTDDGSAPGLGLHRGGVNAATLYLGADTDPRWINNSGVDSRIWHSGNLTAAALQAMVLGSGGTAETDCMSIPFRDRDSGVIRHLVIQWGLLGAVSGSVTLPVAYTVRHIMTTTGPISGQDTDNITSRSLTGFTFTQCAANTPYISFGII